MIDDANYKLKLVNGKKVLVVNKSKLKLCFERKILTDLAKNTVDETLLEETSGNETNQSHENNVRHTGKKRGPKPKQNPPKSSNGPKRKTKTSAQTNKTSKDANDTIRAKHDLSSSVEHSTSSKTIETNEKQLNIQQFQVNLKMRRVQTQTKTINQLQIKTKIVVHVPSAIGVRQIDIKPKTLK